MPEDFLKCIADGGKVVTKKIDKDRYMHICYDEKGKAHHGEIKTKKKKSLAKEEITPSNNKLENW